MSPLADHLLTEGRRYMLRGPCRHSRFLMQYNRILRPRAVGAVTREIGDRWAIGARAWLERSDRDDPVETGGAAPNGPRLMYGGDIGVALSLDARRSR
jgi:hypothetical protein